MRKYYYLLTTMLVSATFLFGQAVEIGSFNTSTGTDPTDENRPWYNETNHVRSATIAYDLDQDGKNEILATDYALGGRVHVFEFNESGVLELVWSSPVESEETNLIPRWVQSGDLDGDGNKEIIFPTGLGSYEGAIRVYEYTGTDNDYGTSSIIDFPPELFETIGTMRFRMNRERGTVADFDGDGKDELITANEDNRVYILGINGNAPGFASWQIEGGDPSVVAEGRHSGGSWWHSVFVDYNGDGVNTIVNHYWNFYGFWAIQPTGADTYTYPPVNGDGGVTGPTYFEYMNSIGEDAVAYMGVVPCDVDGDGNQEIAGSFWVGSSDYNYRVSLLDIGDASTTGIEVFDSQDQFAILKDSAWTEVDISPAEYWGNGAADLNGNGKDEILLGGVPGNMITTLEYTGEGSILDGNNYEANKFKIFDELPTGFEYYDSAGVEWTDTISSATSYFIAKMDVGDLTGNGKVNVVVAYQTVPDSLTHTFYTWDGSAFVEDEEAAYSEYNPNAINLRVLEADESTGLRPVDITVVTPDDYQLEQNYPNPFNPATTIRFALPLNKEISLKVYDMLGREVKTLIGNQELAKGSYEVEWDGTNDFGKQVASGTYIATLKYGNFSKSIKMSLLK